MAEICFNILQQQTTKPKELKMLQGAGEDKIKLVEC